MACSSHLLRDPDRAIRQRHRRLRVLLLGFLDAPLDVPDRVQILGDARPIARAERPLQPGRSASVTESRMLRSLSQPCRPLLRRAAAAEQTLEHDPRIRLGKQRRRRRAPGDGVQVDAAVAVLAHADVLEQIEADLERLAAGCPCRASPRRSDRRSSPPWMSAPSVCFGWTPLNHVAAGARVVAAAVADAVGHRLLETAEHDQLIAKRRERTAAIGGSSKFRARRRRRPLVHDRAVRNVDEPETTDRRRAVLARVDSAGTIASRSGSASVAPDAAQERPPWQRHLE